jgi:Type III restriction enzyme, res subunit
LKIHFCSAPCGSGKTYQVIERACQLAAKGEYVLVLQPTKELIDKTVEALAADRPNPPEYLKFYTDNDCSKSVGGRLTEHFKNPPDQGHIVFATHQVLPFIPFWANKGDWHVLIDEELQVVKHNCFNLPKTHGLITDLIDLEPRDAIYSRLVVADPLRLSEIAQNKDGDDIYEWFRETAQLLINENWDSFVNTEQFAKLKDNRAQQLSIHSVLSPRILGGCRSVTMTSANLSDTLIYKVWEKMGVEFQEDDGLSQSLRFQHHSNGHLITIKYATEQSWSKALQGRRAQPEDQGSGSVLNEVIEAAKAEFHNQPFLWQANKSLPDNPFGDNAQRLPNKPHGLNDYSNIDRLCFLSALNPTADHFKFLKSRGLSNEAVHAAIYCSTVYQSVMRSSIRDPENLNAKTIIVPDRTAAEYLAKLFPGSRINKLNTRILENTTKSRGRPKRHNSNRDKVAAHRKLKRLKKLQDLLKSPIFRPYPSGAVVGDRSKTCNERAIDISGIFVTGFDKDAYGTLFASKNSQDQLCYLHTENLDDFVDFLKLFHENNSCSRKDANWLISPAVFDPNHPKATGTKRGLSNIVKVRNLWMDFENGQLNPEQVAELFPMTKLVVFNTHSHTWENPRFRVVFPFDQPLDADDYGLLYDQLIAKIEDAGYEVGRSSRRRPSGLDISKRTPSSLFYLPCVAKVPTNSFFLDYYHDESRAVLNPRKWIEHSVVVIPFRQSGGEREGEMSPLNTTFDQSKVDEATRIWRESVNYPGEGNARFWSYARALRSAGMSLEQIEQTLKAESMNARKPSERRGQIPSIMKSLQQSWKKAV